MSFDYAYNTDKEDHDKILIKSGINFRTNYDNFCTPESTRGKQQS